MTDLEKKLQEIQAEMRVLAGRVQMDAVARSFMTGSHEIREGDYFLLYGSHPTRLSNVSSEGKWTYVDAQGRCIEPFATPDPKSHERLYTIAEVAEILAMKART